ncbi:MAG: hypothetical protein IPP29_25195 [Bacteroidetes bacterium]|nr:hypothetical protein [Bacteroidota bacterium]
MHYIATSTILAGATVAVNVDDDDQPIGNYTIEPVGDVQFTAPDLISLRDGFSAKTGCTFKAKCESPVMQPQCPPSLIGSGGSKMAPQFAQQNKTNASSGIIIPNPSNGIFTYRTINFSPENTASIKVINSMGVK